MPIMDGLECTKRVRDIEQRDHIRPRVIIGITSHTAEYYIQSCKESGMNEVLSKPISMNSLLDLIKKIHYLRIWKERQNIRINLDFDVLYENDY